MDNTTPGRNSDQTWYQTSAGQTAYYDCKTWHIQAEWDNFSLQKTDLNKKVGQSWVEVRSLEKYLK